MLTNNRTCSDGVNESPLAATDWIHYTYDREWTAAQLSILLVAPLKIILDQNE